MLDARLAGKLFLQYRRHDKICPRAAATGHSGL